MRPIFMHRIPWALALSSLWELCPIRSGSCGLAMSPKRTKPHLIVVYNEARSALLAFSLNVGGSLN